MQQAGRDLQLSAGRISVAELNRFKAFTLYDERCSGAHKDAASEHDEDGDRMAQHTRRR